MTAAAQLLPHEIPTDYRGAYRSVAFLLRAFRRAALDGAKDHRKKAFPRELTGAIEGEHKPGDACSTWLTRLARRWDVALSGDDEGRALRVYLPDGWATCEVVCARVPSVHLDRIVEDADALAAFAVRFGPVPGRDDEAAEREIDAAVLDVAEPARPADPWLPPALAADAIVPRRWRALWRAEGAFAHGADEKTGNVVGIRRAPRVDRLTGRQTEVPFLAGNAARGLARRVLFGDLAQRAGFDWGAVKIPVAHSLLDGGAMEGSTQTMDVEMRRRLRALLPPLDLFGATWCRTDAMGGWLVVEDAVLVCRETAGELAAWLAPDEDPAAWAARLLPAAELVTQRQMTSEPPEVHDPATKVLARVEVVVPGTLFAHRVGLDGRVGYGDVPPLVASCLAHMLDLLARRGIVGAAGARGMGRMAMDRYRPEGGAAELPSPDLYLAHLDAHAGAILETVLADRAVCRTVVPVEALPTRAEKPAEEKPAKGAKKGRAKAEPPAAQGSLLASPEDIPL